MELCQLGVCACCGAAAGISDGLGRGGLQGGLMPDSISQIAGHTDTSQKGGEGEMWSFQGSCEKFHQFRATVLF